MTLIRDGHVIDPGSMFSGTADVLLEGGRIAAVGPRLDVRGVDVIDANGLVVGPGFVNLHNHAHSVAGHWLQAFDGVTTTLDLEAGLSPVEEAYRLTALDGRPLNYGFSASWALTRAELLLGRKYSPTSQATFDVVGIAEWQRSTTRRELTTMLGMLEHELSDGALGLGVLLGYAPHSDPAEYRALAELAARSRAPLFTHIREVVETDPSIPIDGVDEISDVAQDTGAAIHMCHVNSSSRRHLDRALSRIGIAQDRGARLSIEAYPYDAGATAIGAAFLAPERLAARGMAPTDIVMIETGEQVSDAARLRELRAADPGAACINRFLREEDPADGDLMRRPFELPNCIPASDAVPVTGTRSGVWPLPSSARTHPRTGGTFTKTVRMMVLESQTWTWLDAFTRASFLPARLLDGIAPAARMKGRLDVGSDADIVILDPATTSETATYHDSTRLARGVRHLIVGGTHVIREGELSLDARPGRPLRGEPR